MDALDFSQVQTVLHTIDSNLTLRQIQRPESGLTGSVFVLQTDRQDLILRAFSDTSAAWKPEKERIVYHLLRGQGIPVPNVLKADLSRSLFPFAYVVSERLPGGTLSKRYDAMTAAQRCHVYGQLGDFLGRIHSVSFEEFGDVRERSGSVTVGPARELEEGMDAGAVHSGPFNIWREMHRQIVRWHLLFLEQTEFFDLVAPLDAWFREHEGLLDEAITPRLLHMDLHMSNILVDGDTVTGILDVEEALVGHHEFDLMRTELAHFRGEGVTTIQKAFFDTYAEHITLDEGYARRRPFYELSRNLVGLRCLVTYGSRYSADLESERRLMRVQVKALLDAY